MHESMIKEIGRQHIQDLQREASNARVANSVNGRKKRRSKSPKPPRARPNEAIAG